MEGTTGRPARKAHALELMVSLMTYRKLRCWILQLPHGIECVWAVTHTRIQTHIHIVGACLEYILWQMHIYTHLQHRNVQSFETTTLKTLWVSKIVQGKGDNHLPLSLSPHNHSKHFLHAPKNAVAGPCSVMTAGFRR